MSRLNDLYKELNKLKSPLKAKKLQGYFKTGKGEYGAGDKFIGLTVPDQRKIAHRFLDLDLPDISKLLDSDIHEHRFTALEILTEKYKRAAEKEKNKIAKFYLKVRNRINNWDLVDTSASYILGAHLLNKKRDILYRLAKSKNIWDRRIAIISTYKFIKNNDDYGDTFKIAEMLMKDTHDLIHKAVGWMLREAGNRSVAAEEAFLEKHAHHMPRTMLRYAIEKFSPEKRKYYLEKKLKV